MLAAVLSAACAQTTVQPTPLPGQEVALYGPKPQSVDDLVARVPVVMIGTYGERLRVTCEAGWGIAAADLDERRLQSATYYEFAVEQVLYRDASVARPFGTVEVRQRWHDVDGDILNEPAPRPGDRRLLFAHETPDGAAYMPAPWGDYDVEGDTVRHSLPRRPSEFGEIAPDVFVQTVLDALDHRGPLPPVPGEAPPYLTFPVVDPERYGPRAQYPILPGRAVEVEPGTACLH